MQLGSETLTRSDPTRSDPQHLPAPRPWVLLVDDGELDDLREIAESLGASVRRHPRDAAEGWRQPQRLLVVSDRRVPDLGRPTAQEQDRFVTLVVMHRTSRVLRERIHRMGFDLVVERPVDGVTLRALLRDALYRGPEQRRSRRMPVGYPVTLRTGWRRRDAQLIELNARGCSLRLGSPLSGARRVSLAIPPRLAGGEPLHVEGSVVRECSVGDRAVVASLIFHLDAPTRQQLERLLASLEPGPPPLEIE
ncbi:MAG: PilZ domain-containing protein [Myxococcota bacterium]